MKTRIIYAIIAPLALILIISLTSGPEPDNILTFDFDPETVEGIEIMSFGGGFAPVVFQDVEDIKHICDNLNSLVLEKRIVPTSYGTNYRLLIGDYSIWTVNGKCFSIIYRTAEDIQKLMYDRIHSPEDFDDNPYGDDIPDGMTVEYFVIEGELDLQYLTRYFYTDLSDAPE